MKQMKNNLLRIQPIIDRVDNLVCSDLAEYGDFFYMSHAEYNGLYRVSMESLKVERVATFPNVEEAKRRIHYSTEVIDDLIWFFPFDTNVIHSYNPLTGEISFFTVEDNENNNGEWCFSKTVIYCRKAYLFPFDSKQSLYIFDFYDHSISKIHRFNSDIRSLTGCKAFSLDINAFCLENDILWIAIMNTSIVIKMNLSEAKYEKFTLKGDYKLRGIFKDNSVFYATLTDKPVILSFDCLSFCPKEIKNEAFAYDEKLALINIVKYGNSFFVIPSGKLPIQYFKKDEVETHLIGVDWKRINKITFFSTYASCVYHKGYLWLFPRSCDKLIRIDTSSYGITMNPLRIERDDFGKKIFSDLLKWKFFPGNVNCEHSSYYNDELQLFIEMVKNQ